MVPLGGVIFHAAGRHPLAGIAAAFAGVSGGFSATLFIPSGLDPLLAGLTQAAARLSAHPAAAEWVVNPLCNFFFTTASALMIIGLGWAITDLVIEPRLRHTAVDTVDGELPRLAALTPQERRALRWALLTLAGGIALLIASALPSDSAWRGPDGNLASAQAPLMKSIIALIFLLFLLPGVVYGLLSGRIRDGQDLVQGMSQSMNGMSYYLVMAFFCAQFLYAFGQSNLGVLLTLKGASALQSLHLPLPATVVGVVLLTASVNLVIGSASAKWALLGPVLVPMLMELGLAPEFTQAAYRIGDSSTHIITPLMAYFPLIVVFCQRYVKSTGIGTLMALMLPYTLGLLFFWTLLLLGFWALDLPLGIGGHFHWPPSAS